MLVRAISLGGGSNEYYDYPLIQTGLTVLVSRCTIKEGGYFVKSGRCFFDITLKILISSNGNMSYLNNMPAVTTTTPCASSNGSKWGAYNNGTYWTLDSNDTIPQSGDIIRCIGAYNTSASDTV